MQEPETLEEATLRRQRQTHLVTSLSGVPVARQIEEANILKSFTAHELKMRADLEAAQRAIAEALGEADQVAALPPLGVVTLTPKAEEKMASIVAREKESRKAAESVLGANLSRLSIREANKSIAAAKDSLTLVKMKRRITASGIIMNRVKELDKVRIRAHLRPPCVKLTQRIVDRSGFHGRLYRQHGHAHQAG
jgi:hypothetical protein